MDEWTQMRNEWTMWMMTKRNIRWQIWQTGVRPQLSTNKKSSKRSLESNISHRVRQTNKKTREKLHKKRKKIASFCPRHPIPQAITDQHWERISWLESILLTRKSKVEWATSCPSLWDTTLKSPFDFIWPRISRAETCIETIEMTRAKEERQRLPVVAMQ